MQTWGVSSAKPAREVQQIFVIPSRSSLRETSHRHGVRRSDNFHVIVKKIIKFDGRRAEEFLEWGFKLRATLSVYNKTISNALQG